MSAFSGRTVLVTGASTGIGREIARQMHEAGAAVVLLGRNPAATTALGIELDATAITCDYAQLDSVREASTQIAERVDLIDVMFSNAGAAIAETTDTGDGNERNFQVNTLAPVLLESLLQPLLSAAPAGRVVATSSRSHRAITLSTDGFRDELRQTVGNTHHRYARAKLATLLVHAHERRIGQHVPVADVHPGIVASGFGRYLGRTGAVLTMALRPVLRSPARAAATLVGIAALPSAAPYYYRDHVQEPSPLVYDDRLATAVSAYVSERITRGGLN